MLRGSRTAGRAGRGVLCVLLAASWSGVAGTMSQPARAQPAQRQAAQRPAARGGDPVAIVAGLRARVDRLMAAARQASDQPLDPTALVARVGRDPATLARWVREQVRFEPYSGFMKGARGAIVSRRANSADKALLLAEALQAGGVKARLVRGKIDPKTLPSIELPPRENSPDPDAAALGSFSTSSGIPVARLQSLLNEGRAQRQAVAEDLWTRFQRDFEVVAGQLQAANVPPPPAPAFSPSDEHWWVRADAGDLDPTVEAKPGAQEAAVFELNKLPADAFHTLTVRMKIKRDDGTESVVLDAPLRAADLFGRTLVLGNMPVEGMEKLEKLGSGAAAPTPEQVIAALASTTKFQPQLATPAGPVAGAPFDLAGNVLPMSKGRIDAVADAGAAQRGAFGGFGGLGGGGAEKKESKTGLASCWVEYALGAPGSAAPVIVRRDLLAEQAPVATPAPDAAGQKVLDLLAMRELLVLPEDLSEAFVADATLDFAVQSVEHLAAIVGTLGERPMSMKNYAGAPRLSAPLLGFGSSRRTALRQMRDTRFKDVTFVHDRPTLVSHVRRFVTGKQPRSIVGIDILRNDLVPVGQKQSDWGGTFALAAGVLDTALEHVCNAAPGPHSNASVFLDRALIAGQKPVAATGPALAALKVGDVARKQMQGDGERVAHVVIPGDVAAWYAVRLDTGMSLGYVEGGGGQDTSEYVELTDIVIQIKDVIEFYQSMFMCIAIAVVAPLAGNPDSKRDFLQCVWSLVCEKLPDTIATMTHLEMDSWTSLIVHQTAQQINKGICQKLFDTAMGPK